MYRGPYDHMGLGLGFGLLFLLLMGAAVTAVVIGILALTRKPGPPRAAGAGWPLTGTPGPYPGAPAGQVPSAEQLLADRLARGEIDVADYEERIAALRRHAGQPYPPAPPTSPQPPAPSA